MNRWRARLRLVPVTVRTITLFTRVEIGLRRTDLSTLATRLGLRLGDAGGLPILGAPAITARQARQALTVVTRVSRHWPGGDTCLRRCLVLGALLAPLRPVLTLGVRRTEDGTIAAHSWLVVGGRSIDPMSGQYGVLA